MRISGALLLLSACLLHDAVAQTPASTPEPVITAAATPGKRSPFETLIWEAQLAENSYTLGRTDATLSALVGAYERLLGPLCMPDLARKMEHKGGNLPDECTAWIEKTIALDELNPVALCARDGIAAASCREAFAGQAIMTYSTSLDRKRTSGNPWAKNNEDKDLELKLAEAGGSARLREFETKIENAERQYYLHGQTRPAERAAIVEALEGGIQAGCRLTRLRLVTSGGTGPAPAESLIEPTPAPEPTASVFGGTRSKGPIEEVLSSLGRPNPTPKPASAGNSKGVKRTRYVADRCLTFVNKLLKYDRANPVAICGRDGFYTPTCTEARRARRGGSTPGTGPGTRQPAGSNDGFSSF